MRRLVEGLGDVRAVVEMSLLAWLGGRSDNVFERRETHGREGLAEEVRFGPFLSERLVDILHRGFEVFASHPPSRVARPDQVDERHGFAEPRLTKRIKFPLVFETEFGIHGIHSCELGLQRAMVLEKDSPLAAQFDEIAVDEAVEDRDLRLCDRHDEWAEKEIGEERNGNVSLGLLTQERWKSKLGERSDSFSFDCNSLTTGDRIWKLLRARKCP